MKQRTLPIDPNTKKPFRDRAEMQAWLILEKFILTGERSPLVRTKRLKAA